MSVRVAHLVSLLAACVLLAAAAGAALGGSAGGRLSGVTEITYGCPGPQRVGEKCEHWFTFASARFALTGTRDDGTPVPGSRRVVVSNRSGRFSVSLPGGTYTVTPLAQAHTTGGPSLRVHVLAGRLTRVTVRFLGFPMMQ